MVRKETGDANARAREFGERSFKVQSSVYPCTSLSVHCNAISARQSISSLFTTSPIHLLSSYSCRPARVLSFHIHNARSSTTSPGWVAASRPIERIRFISDSLRCHQLESARNSKHKGSFPRVYRKARIVRWTMCYFEVNSMLI
jgi:hypothetical protein